jgi:glutaredoxin
MQTRWWMLAGLLVAQSALAQYKVVGPDGRVTYTDRPPPAAAAQPVGRGAPAAAPADAGLPFELRQTLGKYPVTLYTTNNCAGCDAARTLLRQRGVPHTEKTVNTREDAAAFQRTESATELPVMRLGGQQIKGFNDGEWHSYLDAAGYPKQSQLPSSYQFRAATALAPPAPATARAAAPASAPAARPELEPTPPPTPGGIRF